LPVANYIDRDDNKTPAHANFVTFPSSLNSAQTDLTKLTSTRKKMYRLCISLTFHGYLLISACALLLHSSLHNGDIKRERDPYLVGGSRNSLPLIAPCVLRVGYRSPRIEIHAECLSRRWCNLRGQVARARARKASIREDARLRIHFASYFL